MWIQTTRLCLQVSGFEIPFPEVNTRFFASDDCTGRYLMRVYGNGLNAYLTFKNEKLANEAYHKMATNVIANIGVDHLVTINDV